MRNRTIKRVCLHPSAPPPLACSPYAYLALPLGPIPQPWGGKTPPPPFRLPTHRWPITGCPPALAVPRGEARDQKKQERLAPAPWDKYAGRDPFFSHVASPVSQTVSDLSRSAGVLLVRPLRWVKGTKKDPTIFGLLPSSTWETPSTPEIPPALVPFSASWGACKKLGVLRTHAGRQVRTHSGPFPPLAGRFLPVLAAAANCGFGN